MSDDGNPSPSKSSPSTELGQVVINEKTVENLARQEIRQFLIERMNLDSGLCDKLRTCGVLTKFEHDDVKNWRTPSEKNTRLLDIVTEKEKYKEFCNALIETNQGHLVNYSTANGVYSDEYLYMWPLTDKEVKILEDNREFLVENMDTETSGLINKMFTLKVINIRQKRFLTSKTDEISRNETLLDILWGSSLRDYMIMIQCLQDTNQTHVANVLHEGGVIVPVHNTLEVDDAAEMELVRRIRGLLGDVSRRDQVRIMELTLIGASKTKSIILYFWCQKVEELLNLHKFLHNGELKKRIESFLNRFDTDASNITVISTLPNAVFERCKASLEAARDRQDTLDEKILKLCEKFPVLEVQVTQMEEDEDEEMGESKEEEVTPEPVKKTQQLEEKYEELEKMKKEPEYVDAEERFEKVELQKTTGQPAVFFRQRDVDIMADILRNNTEYLMDNMCTRGLLDQLHIMRCLTDEETRYIKTLKHDTDKNEEILKVIRNRNIDTYNKFVDILRYTDQHIIAEVVQRGGVVVKATVTMDEEHEGSEEITKKLVNSLNQLLSNKGPIKPQLLQFIYLLKRNGLDIVGAKYETDIILSLWCRSGAALKKLDKVNESDEDLENLIKILNGLFRLLVDEKGNIPAIINIDLEDTDRRFVCHTPCLKHFKDLPIASQNVCGIAELDEKFYFLSQNPSKITKFESLDSTESETWILSSVKDPVEIVSSNKHHCLYISDTGSSSIWKATSDDRKVTQWLENISNSFTMSLTKDEHVLLLRRDQPATIEVYDSNAKQILRQALPSNIVRPIHAVKSMIGSYFISFRGENEGQSGICEMTENGDTVTLFDSSINHIEEIAEDINQVLSTFVANEYKSCNPEDLALDKRGNLYATDPHNRRLMLLDGRLNLETILTEDLIKTPVNMQFVKIQNQLMVLHGAENQKTLSVLDIQ